MPSAREPQDAGVEGRPLPVATLRLSPRDKRNGATGDRDGWRSKYNRLTDAQGRFRFDGIATGKYAMEIEYDDHTMIARWPVEVADGVTNEATSSNPGSKRNWATPRRTGGAWLPSQAASQDWKAVSRLSPWQASSLQKPAST